MYLHTRCSHTTGSTFPLQLRKPRSRARFPACLTKLPPGVGTTPTPWLLSHCPVRPTQGSRSGGLESGTSSWQWFSEAASLPASEMALPRSSLSLLFKPLTLTRMLGDGFPAGHMQCG